jgi:uncharacterized surface protein with fasciclin (FAS1) repeats
VPLRFVEREQDMKRASTALLAAAAMLVAGCEGNEDTANGTAAEAAGGEADAARSRSIGQSLAASADHSTLASAVKAAGIDGTLGGSQPYTLFAPTNPAFQKLPNAQALMQPEQKGQLIGILTYHIVPGVVTAEDLTRAIEQGGGKAEIATMAGGNLTAAREGDALVITDGKGGKARVTGSEVRASNGVVHSVDTVLAPA